MFPTTFGNFNGYEIALGHSGSVGLDSDSLTWQWRTPFCKGFFEGPSSSCMFVHRFFNMGSSVRSTIQSLQLESS